jgi:hypothetical protein
MKQQYEHFHILVPSTFGSLNYNLFLSIFPFLSPFFSLHFSRSSPPPSHFWCSSSLPLFSSSLTGEIFFVRVSTPFRISLTIRKKCHVLFEWPLIGAMCALRHTRVYETQKESVCVYESQKERVCVRDKDSVCVKHAARERFQ